MQRNVGQSAAFVYNNLPLTIPDNNPAGGSSTATVAGVPGPITAVEVRVQATHTWVGDLIFTLTSPQGTAITLLDRPGVPASGAGCSDDNVNVTFRDGEPSPESVCSGAGAWPVTLAAPVTPLAGLNGQDANGTWTLTVSDNASVDVGTLTDWELIITPAAAGICSTCPVAMDADLSITKTGTAANPLLLGGTVTYTLTATNNGPGAAAGVVVTDPLPSALTYVSNSCGATFVAPTLTWTIGALANGSSATCTIVTTARAPGTLANTASITSSGMDGNAANNAATSTLAGAVLVTQLPVLTPFTLVLLGLVMGSVGVVLLRRS